MVSEIAWLEGGSALAVLLFACTIGVISIRKGNKMDANLLKHAGYMIFFVGLFYLGPVVDFISILLFQQNIDNSFGLYGILSYMWVGPAIIFGMSIGGQMITPEKKKDIVISFAVLAMIFELFLFLNTMQSFVFKDPLNPATGWTAGEDLIDSSFVRMSGAFLFIAGFLGCILVFNGVGFLVKAFKSSGIVKKKFLYLSIGFFIFVIAGAGDSLLSPGITLVIFRGLMMTSAVFLYMGLKT